MTRLEIIESREKNIRLELIPGIIALIISLVFVFSNRIGYFYQIYYVIVVFAIHQIIQAILFNIWNFSTAYSSKKIGLRILIIALVLILAFLHLGKIDSHYSYYLGFKNDKPRTTFISVIIYCGIYFTAYLIGLKRINKKKDHSKH